MKVKGQVCRINTIQGLKNSLIGAYAMTDIEVDLAYLKAFLDVDC